MIKQLVIVLISIQSLLFSGQVFASGVKGSSPWIDQKVSEQSTYLYSTPEAENLNSDQLLQLVKKAQDSDSDSLVIIKNGKIVVEKYFGRPIQMNSVQSVTKSISSLLIGLLIDEKKISSTQILVSHWYPNWLTDSEKSKITLQMLLSHTSGIGDNDEMWNQPNIPQYMAEKPLVSVPGGQFNYTTGGVQLLAPIIFAASGQSADQMVQQRIFSKLQIEKWSWAKDDSGNIETGGGLYMQPIDMAKIGSLLLNQGKWQNEDVIPAWWIQISTQSSQSFFPDYGLLWWLYNGDTQMAVNFRSYSAVGYGGQYITIYPKDNLVAVRTRGVDGDTSQSHLEKITYWQFPWLIGGLANAQLTTSRNHWKQVTRSR